MDLTSCILPPCIHAAMHSCPPAFMPPCIHATVHLPTSLRAPQAGVGQLYCLLYAALAARGELDPSLADLVAALLRSIAPGSRDHLEWALVARDTAEVCGLAGYLRGV